MIGLPLNKHEIKFTEAKLLSLVHLLEDTTH